MKEGRKPDKVRRRDRRNGADRPGTRFGPRTLIDAVRRRFGLFLLVIGLAVGTGLIVTLLQTPRYAATAEVVLGTSGTPAHPAGRGDRAKTEIQIVRSREMARAVAAALHLADDPAFVEATDTGVYARVRRLLGLLPPPRTDPARDTVDRVLAGRTVEQLAGTYSLTIGYGAADPQLAARVANEYARQYSVGRLAGTEKGLSPLDRPDARVISEAEPPLAPVSPRLPVNLAIAAGVGALLGLIAALVAERRLAGLTTGSEIEERLGLHHLGSVPMLESVVPDARSPLDAVVEMPMSGFAEAFRSVMMTIRHVGGRGTQVIAVTSALPNEGKTTVAACLARSVALGGDAVVLVDCDSRRRDTSALFGAAGARPGLAEVLRYEATLDEALVRDGPSGAWILPLTGPPAELSDLLGGAAMAELIEELRRRFKRVLIDTAPVLPITGTRALATMVDLVAIVVRWRETPDHAVLAALRLLPRKHVRIGGVVLSQVDMRQQVKFGHGDPDFYYKQYSKYYS